VNLLRDLPLRDGAGNVRVVVETPAGSRVKYKYDEHIGVFEWSRLLPLGSRYPYDYGFLPGTLAEDGDALDALVWAPEPTQIGVIVPSRVIGALRVEQQRDGGPIKRNDRIIAVPVRDPNGTGHTDIAAMPAVVRDELERFFTASLALTGKQIQLRGWADAAEAAAIVSAAEKRF
jgi:inorganic pyrophosphatase